MLNLGNTKRLSLTGLIAVVLALSMTMFGAVVSTASATHKGPHRLHDTAKHTTVKSYIYGKTASGRNVRGVFIPRKFKTVNDKLYAQGRLRGKIVRPGKDRHFVKRGVLIPVKSVDGQSVRPSAARANAAIAPNARACPVLNLVLGPLTPGHPRPGGRPEPGGAQGDRELGGRSTARQPVVRSGRTPGRRAAGRPADPGAGPAQPDSCHRRSAQRLTSQNALNARRGRRGILQPVARGVCHVPADGS